MPTADARTSGTGAVQETFAIGGERPEPGSALERSAGEAGPGPRAQTAASSRSAVETTPEGLEHQTDRKSTRLNSSHANISYAVFCLKKKKNKDLRHRNTQHEIREDIT